MLISSGLPCILYKLPGWRNWFTRTTQNRLGATPWEFESPSRHKACYDIEEKKLLTNKHLNMNNQKGFANIVLIVVIVILVGVVGYFAFVKKSEPVAQQPTPTPTQTNTTVSLTSISKAKLTLNILKNSEYFYDGTRIKLINGTFPLEPLAGESQSDYFVKLDTDHVVFGDLNNDGQEDAVVILVSRSGGTGAFVDLGVMLNLNGIPSNITNQYLGDRTVVNSLIISSGIISVDMIPWDGGTGTHKTINYKLSGNKLVEF